MVDATPDPPDVSFERNRGTPRHARFGGILEGWVDDRTALDAAVAQVNAVQLVAGDLDIEGQRYGLLFSDDRIPGGRVTSEGKERFVAALQRVVDASQADRPVESTLHCTEVFDDTVVETLFGVERQQLRVLSRERPVTGRDAPPPPGAEVTDSMRRIGWSRLLLVLAGLLLIFSVTAWQAGYFDRVFSPAAEEITIERGTYAGYLDIEVVGEWGLYAITIRRGPDYPTTLAAAEQWVQSSESLEESARRKALTEGETVYLRLRSEEDELLAWTKVSLRSLIEDGEAEIEAVLPGRISAHRIDFSLSEPKRR